MIVDCFNIYNEKEILHLRLDYLYEIVDRFVIVESLDSHSKKIRKEKYFFEENIEIYKPYMDKIIYLKIDNLPYSGDTTTDLNGYISSATLKWENENYQKNYCSNGITDLSPDDWILFSDVDEIPNKECVLELKKYYDNINYINFYQKLFYYHVNVLQNQIWGGTVATQKKNFNSMMDLRNHRNYGMYIFNHGGWHYSYMGGVDRVYEKMQSYSEWDANNKYCNIENITKSIDTDTDVLGRNDDMFIKNKVEIFNDNMCPSNMKKIIELYPKLYKN